MSNKGIIIAVVIAVILIVAGLVWYYFYSTKLAPTPDQVNGSTVHPTGGTVITLPGGGGPSSITG